MRAGRLRGVFRRLFRRGGDARAPTASICDDPFRFSSSLPPCGRLRGGAGCAGSGEPTCGASDCRSGRREEACLDMEGLRDGRQHGLWIPFCETPRGPAHSRPACQQGPTILLRPPATAPARPRPAFRIQRGLVSHAEMADWENVETNRRCNVRSPQGLAYTGSGEAPSMTLRRDPPARATLTMLFKMPRYTARKWSAGDFVSPQQIPAKISAADSRSSTIARRPRS